MSMDEDKDGLAAEYVLGTLDAEERAQADALMLVDQDFATKVGQWERRLGELNALVAPVEPPAPLWERIQAGLASTGQSEHLHLPEVAAPSMRRDAPGAEIIQMRQRMQRWRGATIIAGLMAASIAGIFLVRANHPDLLPADLRPIPQVVERIVERPVEVVREIVREVPAAQPAQLVAVFQKDEQSPAFLMSVDLDKRTISVRPVAADRLTDKSYQLWIAPQPGAAPQPLGVLANDASEVKATLAAYEPSIINNATFGISLEPLGGSPTGQPTGPVIHARLIEVPRP
jgi:anti-sigma-K factor RskA